MALKIPGREAAGIVQQECLPIDELHLVLNMEFMTLAERVKEDVKYVSPETKVVLDIVQLEDPWDFEEVYGKFYDYAKSPCFHKEKTEYYIHISTGSHVEQICLFLLAESRHLAAKLVQTSPKEGHVRHSHDPKGTINVIDLDLSRYDRLAKRFELERQDDLSFLKRGIDTKNAAFNKRFRADLLARINLWSFSLPGLGNGGGRREEAVRGLSHGEEVEQRLRPSDQVPFPLWRQVQGCKAVKSLDGEEPLERLEVRGLE